MSFQLLSAKLQDVRRDIERLTYSTDSGQSIFQERERLQRCHQAAVLAQNEGWQNAAPLLDKIDETRVYLQHALCDYQFFANFFEPEDVKEYLRGEHLKLSNQIKDNRAEHARVLESLKPLDQACAELQTKIIWLDRVIAQIELQQRIATRLENMMMGRE